MAGLTEAEAKGKWCPEARTTERWPEGGSMARNRVVNCEGDDPVVVEHLIGCQCIASACMAWRWTQHGAGCTEEFGYCGLAGRM